MDISVRHLNHRMSVQVPASLPLGLVFVVGNVANIQDSTFDLVENGYHLRCQRTERIEPELMLENGDRVRAGGHLTFDATQARYLLITRDIERLVEARLRPQGRSEMGAILKDISNRAAAVQTVNEEMPTWVKRLAPPEVRPTLEIEGESDNNEIEGRGNGAPIALNDEMVLALSRAMDSDEDVELTPEMLVKMAENMKGGMVAEAEMPANISAMYEELPAPPPAKPEPTRSSSPPANNENETVLIVILVLLILLMIAAIGIVFITNFLI